MDRRTKFLKWLLYFFAIAWVLILSELVFSNLRTTTDLREQLASQNPQATLLVLETKVVELSEQMSAIGNTAAKVDQTELDALKNHWDVQFKELQLQSRQYASMYASRADFMQIVEEVKVLQERLHALEQKALPPQLPQSSPSVQSGKTLEPGKVAITAPQNVKPAPVVSVTSQPPFKIHGIELRQGEQVLFILPHAKTSIADSKL
ncbi:MAG: hypothetical protein ACRCWR_00535, partial [Saezia sp.]